MRFIFNFTFKVKQMRVKYQRTSTIAQLGNRFQTDTENYHKVFFDQGVSGLIPFRERTEAKKLIKLVEGGGVSEIVLEELRDLGRNMIDVLNSLSFFEEKDVCLYIRSLALRSHINGKKNELWNLVTGIMSSLYAMELENLRTRTQMGLVAYQLRGGKLGRPSGSFENERAFLAKPKSLEIARFLKMGKSIRDISGRLNVSTATVQKVRNLINIKASK